MSNPSTKNRSKLRSVEWFGRHDRDALVHRSWMKNQGFPHDQFDGRPVIGICNTWSEATPCNAHFRELAEHVRRGVLDAGGFPLEFPVMSLGETLMRPTTMLFRNQAAMDVEESIRANPFDGVVLLMGCDKTTPSLLMGAASCDLPTIGVSGGPMLNGKFRGEDIGSGTHVWKFTEMLKKGEMTESDMVEAEACMSRSAGHCMTMGTASTMASMVEALGMGLPTNAAIPAVDYNPKVITPLESPFKPQGGIAVLKGNLAPDGAVLKPSAATPILMQHKGRAVVFEDVDDLHARIDDPALDVRTDDILVLKNCGPKGYPGFPEVGNFALPAKILKQGATDMIRISDARMSGTAYGTVVLHTSPEAAIGGPLALVQNGDTIEVDVERRLLQLHVSDAELAKRKAAWKPSAPHADRGWVKLYCDHVNQAHQGVALDFLVGHSGAAVGKESH